MVKGRECLQRFESAKHGVQVLARVLATGRNVQMLEILTGVTQESGYSQWSMMKSHPQTDVSPLRTKLDECNHIGVVSVLSKGQVAGMKAF